jgi:ATP-binding cassette, subfamily C (CFTR/MRP), member 1
MLRGALVTVVYGKTMELDITVDKSATLTLMSTDVERIGTGLALVHEMWASMIELGLSIWLLDIQIGIACIAPIVVAIGGFAACLFQNRN